MLFSWQPCLCQLQEMCMQGKAGIFVHLTAIRPKIPFAYAQILSFRCLNIAASLAKLAMALAQ